MNAELFNSVLENKMQTHRKFVQQNNTLITKFVMDRCIAEIDERILQHLQ